MKRIKMVVPVISMLSLSLIVGCDKESVSSNEVTTKNESVKNENTSREQYYTRGVLFLKKANLKKVKVTEVINGDTLKIEMDGKQETLHTSLVETPKREDFQESLPPLMVEMINLARKTVEGNEVELEMDKVKRDKEGNIQAFVWVDNKLYNAMLLDEGFGRIKGETSNTQYKSDFQKIEASAKNSKAGFWKVDGYVTSSGFDSGVLKNYQNQPAFQTITGSNSTTNNQPPSHSPYTEGELKSDPKAPSTNPNDYNKDGEYVPQNGPSNNPADYNSKGEYKPVEKMTQEEIEKELEGMMKDSLGQ